MTDEELIARLRESQSYEWQDPIWETRLAAADRIEALTKERDQHWNSFVHWRKEADDRAEQLAAARQDAKFAEDELEMQEQEACMMENDYIKLEKERDALEAKLAKAVEALESLIQQTHDCEKELTEDLHHVDFCGESEPLTKARATLAEISSEAALNKGGSHE
jgi:hypothetical protein